MRFTYAGTLLQQKILKLQLVLVLFGNEFESDEHLCYFLLSLTLILLTAVEWIIKETQVTTTLTLFHKNIKHLSNHGTKVTLANFFTGTV